MDKNAMENGKSFKTFCIIGDPIDHSLSPLLHNSSFAHLNMNYSYIAFKVPKPDLKATVESLKKIKASGFNVTLPHKVNIIQYLDCLSDEAKLAGAVNTVNNENGKFVGYNTDIHGLITPIEERKIDFKDIEVLIMGAGGSCRAALLGLSKKKDIAKITIVNRDKEKLTKVIKLGKALGLECFPLDYNNEKKLNEVSFNAHIIINTTSIGLNNESSPLRSKFMRKGSFVFDIVYRPVYTDLLKKAQDAGSNLIFGYEMLIHQAAKSFKIWTGIDAPIDVMKKALFGIFGEPK